MVDLTRVPRRALVLGGPTALILGACSPRSAPSEPAGAAKDVDLPFPPEATVQAIQLSRAATAFGEHLLGRLLDESPNDTVLISPLSLMSVLAMLGQGAQGATAAELGAALGLDGERLALRSVPEAYQSLQKQLDTAPNQLAANPAKVHIANGVWIDQRLGLKTSFARTQADAFSAQVSRADFRDPQLPEVINEFVSKATAGAIPVIVDGFDHDTVLAIVSALYFKAGWDQLFDRALTREENFLAAGGATVKVPMMHAKGWFAFHETAALKAVVLQYADLRFELVLVLPAAASLPPRWATTALSGLASVPEAGGHRFRPGEVFVPRLNLAWGTDLLGTLRSLGLTRTMGSSPDFGGAVEQKIWVNQIAHRTVFEMDETGTEAAAVTMAGDAAAAAPSKPPKPFVFRADRPFGLIVRENRAGAPLFMGRVGAPRT